MADENIQPQAVAFPNGNNAKLITVTRGTAATNTIDALGLTKPKNLILLIGGKDPLDPKLTNQLTQLFSRGIARAAKDAEALLMDGGTETGATAILGQGVADRGRETKLLGVAAAGKVTFPGGPADTGDGRTKLDPNHSHFVLVEGTDSGAETAVLFDLAAAFDVPVLTILVNGGVGAKNELLQSVRHGWPVIIIEGSGGLADEVAALVKQPTPLEDPPMAEILTEGDLRLFSVAGALEDFEKLLSSQAPNVKLLRGAWQQFATYDANANRLQKSFRKLQFFILVLGLAGVFLVVLRNQGLGWLRSPQTGNGSAADDCCEWLRAALGWLKFPIIAIPIATSILLAFYNKFRPGIKWILLRGSAEAMKREIFRYRSRTGDYRNAKLTTASRDDVFHERLEPISRRLMGTDVNHGALVPYSGSLPPGMEGARKADDGISFLSPECYIELRLEDQLAYFSIKAPKLAQTTQRMQVAILVAGGVGTLLAAFGVELWIALTTALATALTSSVASSQSEETLVRYNQSAADLANVKQWWTKLSPAARRNPKNIDQLVEVTEKVLETELSGWVQRMENALAQLKVEEEKGDGKDKPPADAPGQPQGGKKTVAAAPVIEQKK